MVELALSAKGMSFENEAPPVIWLGLGANLPSAEFGAPLNTLEAAIMHLADSGVSIVRRSSWYETAPVPPSDQPNYINGVAEVATEVEPDALLALLHRIETRLGRTRKQRWEARVIDLDLLDYGARVQSPLRANDLHLPHPRMHERGFVLLPLAELEPEWKHPQMKQTVKRLIDSLSEEDKAQIHRLA